MKKIINGHKFDTNTAKALGSWSNSSDYNSLDYVGETLYKTKNGLYFVYGEGGPMSSYSHQIDSNNWSGGEAINPVSEDYAKQWAEEKLTGDEYEEIFGEVDEEEEKVGISATISRRAKMILEAYKADGKLTTAQAIDQMICKCEMKRWVAVDEPKDGTGDTWEHVFKTRAEAEADAQDQWDKLTATEKKHRHVYAADVKVSDLEDYAFDEDDILWTAYSACGYTDGLFDSNNIK